MQKVMLKFLSHFGIPMLFIMISAFVMIDLVKIYFLNLCIYLRFGELRKELVFPKNCVFPQPASRNCGLWDCFVNILNFSSRNPQITYCEN